MADVCSWTDNFGAACGDAGVVSVHLTTMPSIVASDPFTPRRMHKVTYCERHRLARLSQLGAVRADIEVEARLLQTVDYTRDTAFATLVQRTILTETAGLRQHLETRQNDLAAQLGFRISEAIRSVGAASRATPKPPRKARRR